MAGSDNIKILAPQKNLASYATISSSKSLPRVISGEVLLENEFAKIVIDYLNGGKIRSFVSKKNGIEYFYRDKRLHFSPEKGYSYHDISGFDECFPTVSPCCSKTGGRDVEYEDHGFLWQKPWRMEIKDYEVDTFIDVPELCCKFQRTCRLENAALRLEYIISNDGDQSLPFLYSAHPLLYLGYNSRLELPKVVKEAYVAASSDNMVGKWVDIEALKSTIEKGFSAEHKSFIKIFVRNSHHSVCVRHEGADEYLTIWSEPSQLPYLGIYISQGFDPLGDGNFAEELLLGIEPTTGIGDDLATCKATGTLQMIEPGQKKCFGIYVTLRDDPIQKHLGKTF